MATCHFSSDCIGVCFCTMIINCDDLHGFSFDLKAFVVFIVYGSLGLSNSFFLSFSLFSFGVHFLPFVLILLFVKRLLPNCLA